jgi:hypothetical protein
VEDDGLNGGETRMVETRSHDAEHDRFWLSRLQTSLRQQDRTVISIFLGLVLRYLKRDGDSFFSMLLTPR